MVKENTLDNEDSIKEITVEGDFINHEFDNYWNSKSTLWLSIVIFVFIFALVILLTLLIKYLSSKK